MEDIAAIVLGSAPSGAPFSRVRLMVGVVVEKPREGVDFEKVGGCGSERGVVGD